VSLHGLERQIVILTKRGRSHLLAFLAGLTPPVLPNHRAKTAQCSHLRLVHLIRESEHFAEMKTIPPTVDVIRAVQKQPPDALEARILFSSPQPPPLYPSGSHSDRTGGYEILLKDWKSVRLIAPPLRNCQGTKPHWEVGSASEAACSKDALTFFTAEGGTVRRLAHHLRARATASSMEMPFL